MKDGLGTRAAFSPVVRFRIPIFVLSGLLTLASLVYAPRTPINTDILTFLPKDSPNVQLFQRTDSLFGGNHLAIVGVEAQDVFTSASLQFVDSLTRAFQQIEGVSTVTSLTNIVDFRKTEWGVEVTKLLEPGEIPTDPEELRRLRAYVLSRSLYRGRIVSSDGTVTLVLVRIRGDSDREAVARKLRAAALQINRGRYRLYFAGLPFQMEYLGRLIIRDMYRLTPIAAGVVLVTLYLGFRNWRGVLLPFLTVVLSLVWILGFMGATGTPLTMISAATPVLVLAIGSAYGIHLLKRYHELSRSISDPRRSASETVRTVGLPIALAAVTTFCGFLSLLSSELSAIRDFGLVTGLGILFALLVATTLVPAILSCIPIRQGHGAKPSANVEAVSLRAEVLARSLLSRAPVWIGAYALLTLVALSGIPRITREVNLSEYFKPNSDVRVSERLMEHRFGGSFPVQILIEGPIKHPAVLKVMRHLERRLEAEPNLTNAQSVADLICELNDIMNGRYVIPETPEGVANLWFLLEGQDIMQQLVTGDEGKAQIQLRLRSQKSDEIFRAVDVVNRSIRSLPDTFVGIDEGDLPEPSRRLALDYRAQIALRELGYELKKRGVDLEDTLAVRDLLLRHAMRIRTTVTPPPLADRMARAALVYLNSDESEIPVANAALRKKLMAELSKIFSRMDRNGLLPTLRQIPAARSVEPDILEETAEQLWYLACEVRTDGLTDSLMQALAAVLPRNALPDSEAWRDLRAALWELNERILFVPPDSLSSWGVTANHSSYDTVAIRTVQSGPGPIYKEVDSKLLRSQLTSLFIALALVFFVLCLQLGSLRLGLIGTTPLLLTLAVNFGAMGYLGIALDDATLMIAPLAIGIGVDYGIHFTHRLRREISRAKELQTALSRTLQTTGVAILINALSVGLGFCVLLLGDVVPVQRFGLMVALAMLVSAAGALTLLPAFLVLARSASVGQSDVTVLPGNNQG